MGLGLPFTLDSVQMEPNVFGSICTLRVMEVREK